MDNPEGAKDEVTLSAKESGNGFLMVKGDVKLSGSFSWNGIILVGGAASAGGEPDVYGTMIAGLNVLTGTTPGKMQVGHGSLEIRYNSCHVDRASSLLPSSPIVAEEPSTWVESFLGTAKGGAGDRREGRSIACSTLASKKAAKR